MAFLAWALLRIILIINVLIIVDPNVIIIIYFKRLSLEDYIMIEIPVAWEKALLRTDTLTMRELL